jgi:hypothetical protein
MNKQGVFLHAAIAEADEKRIYKKGGNYCESFFFDAEQKEHLNK